MSHEVDEADIEAALLGEMPSPYCERNWRQTVAAFGAAAALVLGLSVEQYLVRDATGGWVGTAVAAAQRSAPPLTTSAPTPMLAASAATPPLTAAAPGAMAAPSAPGVMPVALVQPVAPPGVDPNVVPVARTERTAFNLAATTVRPSVVGVRANLMAAPGQPRVERVGSGVIVDPSGYVVTCHHVVAGAVAITINRYQDNGPPLVARLVAVDNDLALLKVDGAQGLPAATLANSGDARVGDWVLAIGHPFGLGMTVTAGIIGQRHGVLTIPGGRQYTGLIQTDAPINEGSSGGPLVDMTGRVVGLNTAIYAPTGVFSGAGFAIPSNVIADFVVRNVPALGAPRAQLSPLGGGRDA